MCAGSASKSRLNSLVRTFRMDSLHVDRLAVAVFFDGPVAEYGQGVGREELVIGPQAVVDLPAVGKEFLRGVRDLRVPVEPGQEREANGGGFDPGDVQLPHPGLRGGVEFGAALRR